jgi:type IV secretory pathway VirB10-like protein
MISDREDKKNGTVSASTKKKTKENTGTAEAVNSIADTAKQEQLDARAKILEDRKSDDRESFRRKKNKSTNIEIQLSRPRRTIKTKTIINYLIF